MTKKDVTLIVYPAGSYGTFLHWLLEYLQGKLDYFPFTNNGSSHDFKVPGIDMGLPNSISINDYLQNNSLEQFVRTHGQLREFDYNTQRYIEKYKQYVKKIIAITYKSTDQLLLVNNSIDKVTKLSKYRILDKIIADGKHLPFVNSSNYYEWQPWQTREILSYVWCPELDANFKRHSLTDLDIIKIPVRNLLDDFKNTIEFLARELNLSFTRVNQLDDIYRTWISLQQHTHKDVICNQIVAGQLDNWENVQLSIYDEAYIQWQLRVLHNLDLKCNSLNIFPTNYVELKKNIS